MNDHKETEQNDYRLMNENFMANIRLLDYMKWNNEIQEKLGIAGKMIKYM